MDRRHYMALIGLVLTIPCLLGCQSLREKTDALKDSSSELLKWHRKEGTKELETPERIVAIWSESTIFGPNHQPTRGLGGRLYFYNRNHQPVKAQGQLVVYGFEDNEASADEDTEELSKADRKFVFTEEEFANHFSPSEFGPSYSVWLPWDAVGGEKKAISVVPVFKTDEGLAIMGDHSRTLLPGKERTQLAREKARRKSAHQFVEEEDAVTHASFTRHTGRRNAELTEDVEDADVSEEAYGSAEVDDEAFATGSIRASTIRVPPTLRQRLIESSTTDASARAGKEATTLSRSLPARREAARAAARDDLNRIRYDERAFEELELEAEADATEDEAAEDRRPSVRRESAIHRRNGQAQRNSASRFTRPRAETEGLAMERRMQPRKQPSSHRELNSPPVQASQDESPAHDRLP